MIFRDDDINRYTDITLFRKVDELFQKYGLIHNVSIEMKDIWANKEVFWYIMLKPHIKIDLHGWTHKDYSVLSYEEVFADIKNSLDYFESKKTKYFVPDEIMHSPMKKITAWRPPFNKISPIMEQVAKELGLFLYKQWNCEDVWGFHYWRCQEPQYWQELEDKLCKAKK